MADKLSAPAWSLRWMRPTRAHSKFGYRSLFAVVLVVLFWYQRSESTYQGQQDNNSRADGPFEPLRLSGFINTGRPGKILCDDIRYAGHISVQPSFSLHDDIHTIADSLHDHEMIDYSGQDMALSHQQIVDKTWLRMAQSSVWLEKHQVFLTVTRVLFYDKGVRNWPVISFLRGQIHTEDWQELTNYTIDWQGDRITFPTVFNIPTPYVKGGGFYGPEDPRVLIEEGVSGAEPVIVFNMVSDITKVTRAMYLFKPFTNYTTILSINGQERGMAEKNWMPFFYQAETGVAETQYPSRYIYFVYQFKPLQILKCHLFNGWCDFAYKQDVPDTFRAAHNDSWGFMRGGTNFVPLSRSGSIQSYVGFPRTHISLGCQDPFYRPELMILTATSPTHFHIDYMSESIDFNNMAMTEDARQDPCGEGRILIANSIAKWDRRTRYSLDTMTLSFTVDDVTTQVLRLQGVEDYVRGLPDSPLSRQYDISSTGATLFDLQWSAVGGDVLACSVESATNYTILHSGRVNGTNLRKAKEEAEKRIEEEEAKRKEIEKVRADKARMDAEEEVQRELLKQQETKERRDPDEKEKGKLEEMPSQGRKEPADAVTIEDKKQKQIAEDEERRKEAERDESWAPNVKVEYRYKDQDDTDEDKAKDVYYREHTSTDVEPSSSPSSTRIRRRSSSMRIMRTDAHV